MKQRSPASLLDGEVLALDLPVLTLEHALLALKAILGPRRKLIPRARFAFATLEGERFAIDTGSEEIVTSQWPETPDVAVLTNARTLSDLLMGKLDPADPAPEHVFIWGGDRRAWKSLISATRGSQSLLAGHIHSLR
ncbi:MAG: hypothetical protein IT384_03225 [Deltaproteobacteria bacterium]|nr:hypothetical protein [Deltaproteobacteria bacterium]